MTTVEDRHVAYWSNCEAGKETMILLHGLGGNHKGLLELGNRLAEYNVIIPDLPGYGDSEELAVRHTLENYAAFVEKFRKVLGIEHFCLVGHSFGATTALLYAAQHSVQLTSLCLLNPVTESNTFTSEMGRLYYEIACRLPAPLNKRWLDMRPAVYFGDWLVMRTKDRRKRREIVGWDYVSYRQASAAVLTDGFLSFGESDLLACAARITTHSLLLTGNKDPLARPAAIDRLAAQMADTIIVIVPKGGHLLPVEEPIAAGRYINEFMLK